MECPLCLANNISDYAEDKRRHYLACAQCSLVFVPSQFHLPPQQEKAEYDKHQNSPRDKGYRKFLSRLTIPLFKQLGSRKSDFIAGLDFGCGPGPTLSVMAEEEGLQVSDYDLFYFPDPKLLEQQYSFITMTEVIEHVSKPALLLDTLDSMLLPGGILAVMTKRVLGPEAFNQWHYKNDPTHICFYSEATFNWIAHWMNWQLQVIDKDVVFFYKD
ncbi:MAG: class I SAM-dependent methyltransferase [Kangiellaceae bacterium]|nr:class I SAM-dependent methyltransferase [Kangiellaceae bacterium]MCW9016356.1 class I SAM-dependent methyltransferase [Kangiellaceae bacterium]